MAQGFGVNPKSLILNRKQAQAAQTNKDKGASAEKDEERLKEVEKDFFDIISASADRAPE